MGYAGGPSDRCAGMASDNTSMARHTAARHQYDKYGKFTSGCILHANNSDPTIGPIIPAKDPIIATTPFIVPCRHSAVRVNKGFTGKRHVGTSV